jgi:hypothetical protein
MMPVLVVGALLATLMGKPAIGVIMLIAYLLLSVNYEET